jgi:hypothetical protein
MTGVAMMCGLLALAGCGGGGHDHLAQKVTTKIYSD